MMNDDATNKDESYVIGNGVNGKSEIMAARHASHHHANIAANALLPPRRDCWVNTMPV